jgi:hypothetical protein
MNFIVGRWTASAIASALDEENTLTALKTYWRDLIDPKLAEHRGRAGTDFRDP